MLGVRNPLNFPSCVYVWIMNHLGVVFSDVFGLFRGFLVGFLEKYDEISKSRQFRGPTLGVGIPRNSISPCQGVACPRSDAAEREAWTSLRYPEA